MGKLFKFIKWSILIIFILILIFDIIFIVGTLSTNSRKQLDKNFVSEFTTSLKNDTSELNLTDLDVYYKQGKLFLNIYFENDISIEESKIVVKSLVEVLLTDKANKYLDSFYGQSMVVFLTIHSRNNKYYYNSAYYLPDTITDINNSLVNNKYRLWYLTKETGETINSISIN
jgi:hypothetical protein